MKQRLLQNLQEDIPTYLKLFNNFWEESIKEVEEDVLIQCYHATLLFKNWKIALNHIHIENINQILSELHEDVNSSLYLSLFGLYRSAHMHLRSCIELTFQFIYFCEHQYELTQWLVGNFVMKHENLVNYLKGNPRIPNSENSLIDDISLSWKHFSKHIHAEAPIYFQSERSSSKTKIYSKEDFGKWKSNYLKILYRINLLLSFYFQNEFKNFPTTNRDIILNYLKEKDLAKLGLT